MTDDLRHVDRDVTSFLPPADHGSVFNYDPSSFIKENGQVEGKWDSQAVLGTRAPQPPLKSITIQPR